MSGEEVRDAAKKNHPDALRQLIVKRSNPCSSDEFGLSALHYAVWNGHIEPVKLLITNPAGVDKERNRCSVLNLRSTMGYTALHLAALECPKRVVKEITTLLLVGGIDPSIRSTEENKTALQIAKDLDNQPCLAAIEEFKLARTDKAIQDKLIAMRDDLLARYRFQSNVLVASKLEDLNAGFTLPDFLFEEDRVGNRPEELIIHEHHIRPLAESGFFELHGQESMNCLKFTNDQAQTNKMRRDRLMASADPTFKPEKSTLL